MCDLSHFQNLVNQESGPETVAIWSREQVIPPTSDPGKPEPVIVSLGD
jgi:hypothetical protein